MYANTETRRDATDDDSDADAVRVEDLKDDDPIENVLDEEAPI